MRLEQCDVTCGVAELPAHLLQHIQQRFVLDDPDDSQIHDVAPIKGERGEEARD
jgi:hypothetical protein